MALWPRGGVSLGGLPARSVSAPVAPHVDDEHSQDENCQDTGCPEGNAGGIQDPQPECPQLCLRLRVQLQGDWVDVVANQTSAGGRDDE